MVKSSERTQHKFGGKTYLWRDLTKTKREAQIIAEHFRKRGYSARVTKTAHDARVGGK